MVKALRFTVIFFLGLKAYSFIYADRSVNYANNGYGWEEYDSILAMRLHSVEQILSYTDSLNNFGSRDNLQYGELLESVLRKRFYHGYSHYTYASNWVAALAGEFVWSHLSAIVLPEDILKYPMAACSQQSIIMMECFKKIGVDYRKVGFEGHYALEGRLNDNWYLFDSNREPEFKDKRKSADELIIDEEIVSMYYRFPDSSNGQILLNPLYGKVNEAPAPNAAFFHKATYLLSNLLLAFGVIFVLLPLVGKIKKKRHLIEKERILQAPSVMAFSKEEKLPAQQKV